MSTAPPPSRDFCDDLLIQQAVYGLDASDTATLDDLIQQFDISEEDRFEAVIGALDAGFTAKAALPAELQQRLVQDGISWVNPPQPPKTRQTATTADLDKTQGGWTTRERLLGLATAASLMFGFAGWRGWFSTTTPDGAGQQRLSEATLSEQMGQLVNQPGTDRFAWTNPTQDVASLAAAGEVVWNDVRQTGFMVFSGLSENDSSQQQYQLWIFDTERPDETPVDGGVFDIPKTAALTDSGQLIVPIDAKLSIGHAKAFAVTIERPGGVVVSKRERLPLLAGKL